MQAGIFAQEGPAGETGRRWKLMERIRAGIRRLGTDVYHLRRALLGIAIYYAAVHLLFGQFCPMMVVLRFPCPGCGMTRAAFLVLSGRWGEAWKLQPLVFGWIILALLFGANRYLLDKKPKQLTILLIILLFGTIFLYIYRIFCGFPIELTGS